jgi:RHS repeat-associated protein
MKPIDRSRQGSAALRPAGWFVVAMLAFAARGAAAQCTDPTEVDCGDSPPQVIIDPAGGGQAAQSVGVTIYWDGQGNALNASSRQVLVADSNRTASFNWQVLQTDALGRPLYAMSEGTVTLVSNGAATNVRAQICGIAPVCSDEAVASYTYSPPPPPPVVLAKVGTATRSRNEHLTEIFRVVNTTGTPHTYGIGAVCDVPATVCSPSVASLTLAGGDTAVISVNYMLSSTGSIGSVGVRATESTGGQYGFASTTVLAMVSAGGPGGAGDRADLTMMERGMFVTASIASGAAYEGGDLRLVHALPTTTVLGKARTPVLIYNSQHSRPTPIIAAHVIRDLSQPRPDSVTLKLFVEGALMATRRAAWPANRDTVRFESNFQAPSTWLTGVYSYTYDISGPNGVIYSRSGRFSLVNRIDSNFGRGWWLAGLEQLVVVNTEERLWVGGDGSTRLYRLDYNSQWAGPAFDRQSDTLYVDSLMPANWLYRRLPGGTRVYYDEMGRHRYTRNVLGHQTAFTYSGTQLTQIALPENLGIYQFNYTGGSPNALPGHLAEVVAPSPNGAPDSLRVVRVEINQRDIVRIFDAAPRVTTPASGFEVSRPHVAFTTTSLRIVSRQNRLGVPTLFSYSSAGLLNGVTMPMAPSDSVLAASAGDSLKIVFRPAESQGLSAGVREADVYTFIDGPRTDVTDRVSYYLDRWGAPVRVVDPLGRTTTLRRGSTRLPGVVTLVTYPNGREVSASYDDRGNLVSTTDWSLQLGGRYATTTFDYDLRWDAVTRTTGPEGETGEASYDAAGRVVLARSSGGAATSFRYRSDAPGTSGRGLPEYVDLPATTDRPAATMRYEYSSLGNVNAMTQPIAAGGTRIIRTSIIQDAIGRPRRVDAPIDSLGKIVTAETSYYPASDLPEYQKTVGPSMGYGRLAQTLVVYTAFDRERRPLSVERWTEGGNAGTAGHVVSGFRYDAAGRKIADLIPDATPSTLADNPYDRTYYDAGGNVRWVRTRRWQSARPLVAHDTLAFIRMRYDAAGQLLARHTPSVRYAPRFEGIPEAYTPKHDTTCTFEGDPLEPTFRPYPQYPNEGCGYRVAVARDTFTYSSMGLVLTADNPDARITRTYFASGLLETETQRIRTVNGPDCLTAPSTCSLEASGTNHIYTLTYAYDLDGRRIQLTHPAGIAPAGGQPTRWSYRAGTGELETVTDPSGNVLSYAYDARGDLASLTRPGNLVETFRYDQDGQLISQRLPNLPYRNAIWGYTTETLRNETFAYDWRGKLLQSRSFTGYREDLTAEYSGLGALYHSELYSESYSPPTNSTGIFTSNETYQTDGLGNVVLGSSSSNYDADAPATWGNQWSGGNRGTYTHSNRMYAYEGGSGRLLSTAEVSRQFLYSYDPSGNEVFRTQNYSAFEGICGTQGQATCEDRASYYGMDDRLRVAERRTRGSSHEANPAFTITFEEYRYDAIGRRVWVRARNFCADGYSPSVCNLSTVRRTVWDGSAELYEIQMPGWDDTPVAQMESDSAAAQLPIDPINNQDLNPFFGRVLYTYGLGTDQPLSVARMGYNDYSVEASSASPSVLRRERRSISILPLWNTRGQADMGLTMVDGTVDGGRTQCENRTQPNGTSRQYCIKINWPQGWFAYARSRFVQQYWHGTLLEDKRDATGTFYRRNRAYDPATGRFTQEDPIGLAGGLNAYGFAAGDPVTYSDPYGLTIYWQDTDPRFRALLQAAFSYAWQHSETFRRYARELMRPGVRHYVGVNLTPFDRLGFCTVNDNCTYMVRGTMPVRSRSRMGSFLDGEYSMPDVETLAHELAHAAGMWEARIHEERSGVPASCAAQEVQGDMSYCVNQVTSQVMAEIRDSQQAESSHKKE